MGKIIQKLQENLFGMVFNNKRRSRLGVGVQNFDHASPRNYRTCSSSSFFIEFPDKFLCAEVLRREQSFELLRRSKLYLSLRFIEDFESLLGLDWRREWNRGNPDRSVEVLLDLFPSLKYSHEWILPLTARLRKRGIDLRSVSWQGSPWYCQLLRDSARRRVRDADSLFPQADQVVERPGVPTAKGLFRDEYVDIVASEKDDTTSVRVDDICRSHSIWLDPVDAPKELYKWRLRVQKAIAWAYYQE